MLRVRRPIISQISDARHYTAASAHAAYRHACWRRCMLFYLPLFTVLEYSMLLHVRITACIFSLMVHVSTYFFNQILKKILLKYKFDLLFSYINIFIITKSEGPTNRALFHQVYQKCFNLVKSWNTIKSPHEIFC